MIHSGAASAITIARRVFLFRVGGVGRTPIVVELLIVVVVAVLIVSRRVKLHLLVISIHVSTYGLLLGCWLFSVLVPLDGLVASIAAVDEAAGLSHTVVLSVLTITTTLISHDKFYKDCGSIIF